MTTAEGEAWGDLEWGFPSSLPAECNWANPGWSPGKSRLRRQCTPLERRVDPPTHPLVHRMASKSDDARGCLRSQQRFQWVRLPRLSSAWMLPDRGHRTPKRLFCCTRPTFLVPSKPLNSPNRRVLGAHQNGPACAHQNGPTQCADTSHGGGSSTESIGGPRALRSDRHESDAAMRGGYLWTPVGEPGGRARRGSREAVEANNKGAFRPLCCSDCCVSQNGGSSGGEPD